MPTVIGLMTALLLWGCTTTRMPKADKSVVDLQKMYQRLLIVDNFIDRDARLADLAFPILIANTPLCGDKIEPLLGIRWVTYGDFPFWYGGWHRTPLRTLKGFRIGPGPVLTHIVAGGPADLAGLQAGDKLVAVDGEPIPTDSLFSPRRAVRHLLRRSSVDGILRVAYERSGSSYHTTVRPVMGCAYPVRLTYSDAINASANGRSISVTTGMWRFASDLELQTVIAHELAHNVERHVFKSSAKRLLGFFVDLTAWVSGMNTWLLFSYIGPDVFNKDFEREADYVSMYMLARADLDTQGVSGFWHRMAVEADPHSFFSLTHPAHPERVANLDNAHKEIVAKRRAGLALLPNRERERGPLKN